MKTKSPYIDRCRLHASQLGLFSSPRVQPPPSPRGSFARNCSAWIAMLLLFLGVGLSPSVAQNILTNPGFELGGADWSASFLRGATGSVVTNAGVAHSGNNYFSTTGVGGWASVGEGDASGPYPTGTGNYPITATDFYQLRAWVKVPGASTTPQPVTLRYRFEPSGNRNDVGTQTIGTENWTQVTSPWIQPASLAGGSGDYFMSYFEVHSLNNDVTMYVDDCEMFHASAYAITGQVVSNSIGVDGVTVSGSFGAYAASATTAGGGYYTLTIPPVNGSWTLNANTPGYLGSTSVAVSSSSTAAPNIVLGVDPNYDPDLIFSALSSAIPSAGAAWPTLEPPSSTMTPLGSPQVETIGGQQWEKNSRTTSDGYRFGSYVSSIPVTGVTIVAVAKPSYNTTDGVGNATRGEIVDVMYDRVALSIGQGNGQIQVARNGWNFTGTASIPDGQATVISLVIQADGAYKVYTNGVQVMSEPAGGGGMTSLDPGIAGAFANAINVGRNNPDGWSIFSGDIGDVYLYQTAISDSKRGNLEVALGAKFGIPVTPPPTYATVSGTVTDGGSPVVGAVVKATQTANSANFSTSAPTDGSGNYSLDCVVGQQYQLTASSLPVGRMVTNAPAAFTPADTTPITGKNILLGPDPSYTPNLVLALNPGDYNTGTLQWPIASGSMAGDYFQAPAWGAVSVTSKSYTNGLGYKAVDFTGTASLLGGPLCPASLGGANPRTIEVWCYQPSGANGDAMTLIDLSRQGGPDDSNFAFVNSSYNRSIWALPYVEGWNAANSVRFGRWVHLAASYDGVNLNLYVDGALDKGPIAHTFATESGGSISIGMMRYLASGPDTTPHSTANADNWNAYRGWLGAIRVYDAARTAGEIAADYALGVNYGETGTPLPKIVASASGVGGTISPSGTNYVVLNGSQTFTITTSYGYALSQVLVDGVNNPGAVSSGSYTFSNVTADHTIAVSWTPLPSISGTVTGPNGPIYSAFVSASSNSDGSNPFDIQQTDASGNYSVAVPSSSGTYYLIARKGSFVTSAVKTVVLTGSSATGQNFILAATAGLDPLVNLDASALSAGSLSSWTNTGSLGGSLDQGVYAAPTVETVAGKPCVTFDGNTTFLRATFASPAGITGKSDWSAAYWVYVPYFTSGDEYPFGWARNVPGNRECNFHYGSYNRAVDFNGSSLNFSGATTPAAGAWHFIAATYDGSTEKLYVDGFLDNTQSGQTLNLYPGDLLTLGTGVEGDGGIIGWAKFAGSISSLQIYDQVLTADQVATLSGVTTYKWAGPNNGNWSDPGNWNSAVPGPGDLATFSDSASAGATVQLDTAASVKGLEFNNLVPNSTIASSLGNTLTFDDNSFAYTTRSPITVDAGSATISAGVEAYAGIEKNGSGKLTLSGSTDIGTYSAVNPALVVQDGGELELAGPATLEFTRMTGVHGGSTLTISGAFTSSDADQKIGDDFGAGPGYAVLKGSGSWTHTGSGIFCVGVLQYPGTLTINDNAMLDLSGQSSGYGFLSVALGYGGGSTGTVIQNGGTVKTEAVGAAWNGSGGPGVILGNWTGDPCTAEYDLNGGTLITPNVYNVNSSGGVLVAPNGSAVFKFNGGVLQGTQNDNQGDPQVVAEGSTNLMGNLTHAYVQAGGAKINAGTFNCGINQSLEHDPAMGATMDGGLTVQGSGTLTLYRPSTYTGPTKVQGGVLACATNTALGGGSLDISTGGSVALNYSGTRTISQLTFNAGSPQPNGTYGATGSGATTIDNTHFSGTGTVTVTPPVPPTPVWSSSAITMSGGVPTFTFATVAGYKYRLVYKNNLTDASWTVVINPPNYPSPDGWGAVSTGTPATISDPGAVGQSKRFYRVEVANP